MENLTSFTPSARLSDPAYHQWLDTKADALRTAATVLLPVNLTVNYGDVVMQSPIGSQYRFSPLNTEGLMAVRIPAPAGFSAILVRGQAGAHSDRVSVPHAVVSHCLEGAVKWYVAGQEPRIVEAWEPGLPDGCNVIELAPGQVHGFEVLRPCLCHNTFWPELAALL